ncbi:2366_t:CDS:2 [Funneliformis caledonium]|uniref:2366_t:CDS:1 n=1 Tax=Funneliformis caledonium TaxID=1117310 RepID=A0A9N9HQC3_9GLOM|nr:2366_t:CDS:2 [Funneliformis caledonium]
MSKQSRKACKIKAISKSIQVDFHDELDGYDDDDDIVIHDKLEENDNAISIHEAAKGTLKLHTFWEVKKPDEKIDKEMMRLKVTTGIIKFQMLSKIWN